MNEERRYRVLPSFLSLWRGATVLDLVFFQFFFVKE